MIRLMLVCGLAAMGATARAAPLGNAQFGVGMNAGASRAAITAGPDGNVWFADGGS